MIQIHKEIYENQHFRSINKNFLIWNLLLISIGFKFDGLMDMFNFAHSIYFQNSTLWIMMASVNTTKNIDPYLWSEIDAVFLLLLDSVFPSKPDAKCFFSEPDAMFSLEPHAMFSSEPEEMFLSEPCKSDVFIRTRSDVFIRTGRDDFIRTRSDVFIRTGQDDFIRTRSDVFFKTRRDDFIRTRSDVFFRTRRISLHVALLSPFDLTFTWESPFPFELDSFKHFKPLNARSSLNSDLFSALDVYFPKHLRHYPGSLNFCLLCCMQYMCLAFILTPFHISRKPG